MSWGTCTCGHPMEQAHEFAAEVDRLRARLAEAERLAEEWQRRAEMVWRQRDAADRRAEAAEARLAAVRGETK